MRKEENRYNYKNFAINDFGKQYLPYTELLRFLKEYIPNKPKDIIGFSFLGKPVYKLRFGNGAIKVCIWTQMHGNESTGTRAVFDLINFFNNSDQFANEILKHLTIDIVPMLNPDGADKYRRRNAMGIDINRDFVHKNTPETQLLLNLVQKENYDYLFNLHDQRNLFSVGETDKPAILSFLAPSYNKEREVNDVRKKTMAVVASINGVLQQIIPNKIGRYTDEFYPNASGDNFTKMGFPCILIEAGYFLGDEERNKTREYNCIALLEALYFISNTQEKQSIDHELYFNIPQNGKKFIDVIVRNVSIKNESFETKVDIGVMYKYILNDNSKLVKKGFIFEVGNLSNFYGHHEIDVKGEVFPHNKVIVQEDLADFQMSNIFFRKGILL